MTFAVRPNPANVSLKAIDPTTMEVHFLIDHNVAYFPPGFSQSIRLKSDLDKDWISLNETELSSEASGHLVRLENLVPFAEYSVEFKYISRVVSATLSYPLPCHRAEVVAQLVEWSLLTPEIRSFNPDIGKSLSSNR